MSPYRRRAEKRWKGLQGEGSGVEELVLGFQAVVKRDLMEAGCGDGMRLEGEGEDGMEGERK